MMETLFDIDTVPTKTDAADRSEWYTPTEVVEPGRIVMGGIDLDPASCYFANRIIKAGTYYNRDLDGLHRQWYGRVWCNPPYSDYPGQAAHWAEKFLKEYQIGNMLQGILLVNLDQFNQESLQQVARRGLACVYRGRVRFYDPTGNQPTSPRHNNIFLYLGDNGNSFTSEYGKLGIVMGAL
jgi:ParB family chromosome partitioning protein